MKSSIAPPTKAVLSTKECHEYVGGQPIWMELKAAMPDLLKPIRRTPQGWEYYLVSTVDTALRVAHINGTLVH